MKLYKKSFKGIALAAFSVLALSPTGRIQRVLN